MSTEIDIMHRPAPANPNQDPARFHATLTFSDDTAAFRRCMPASGLNPAEPDSAKTIRLLAAGLMQAMSDVMGETGLRNPDIARPVATGLTHVETAVMFGVKAAMARDSENRTDPA
ncbi:MAG: hypothetical protein OXC11_06795 [Rhodospirillales bacterium]|nr:hypothetical protein [Rhodospirillales bacterium]